MGSLDDVAPADGRISLHGDSAHRNQLVHSANCRYHHTKQPQHQASVCYLDSCRTKDDCLFIELVDALSINNLVRGLLLPLHSEKHLTMSSHQWRLVAGEHSLHRAKQISSSAVVAVGVTVAAGGGCFAFVDMKILQPHAYFRPSDYTEPGMPSEVRADEEP